MTHNNVIMLGAALVLWLGTARPMVTAAANRSTTVAAPERRRKLGYVMTNSNIRTVVAAWLSDSASAEATYGHISTWKTGEVTDMSWLFEDASSFNDDISPWDTSSVTTMNGMFSKTSSFNQPIGAWDTSGVRRMDWMFVGSAFNQPIGD